MSGYDAFSRARGGKRTTPQLERLSVLCNQRNLLHLPTQIAHLRQMAAKRELGYLDFLEQASKDKAMARAERVITAADLLMQLPTPHLNNADDVKRERNSKEAALS